MDAQAPNRLTPHQGMEQAPAQPNRTRPSDPDHSGQTGDEYTRLDKTRSLMDAVMCGGKCRFGLPRLSMRPKQARGVTDLGGIVDHRTDAATAIDPANVARLAGGSVRPSKARVGERA